MSSKLTSYFNVRNIELIIQNESYIISIPAYEFPTWIAMDINGNIFIYVSKPYLVGGIYISEMRQKLLNDYVAKYQNDDHILYDSFEIVTNTEIVHLSPLT